MGRQIRQAKRTNDGQLGIAAECTGLYVRVSTALQAEEGYSLAAQQQRLMAYCEAHGWAVCPEHVYVDAGVSGKSTDGRPEFARMMAAAADGQLQRVVVASLDRLARNTADFMRIVDTLSAVGCHLCIVKENFDSSTPTGKFVLTMFSGLAEMEVSTIKERTMTGRKQKAAQAGHNGGRTPFGYRYAAGQWEIVADEAAAVRWAFDTFVAGGSLTDIAAHLLDIAPSRKWTPTSVRNMLLMGVYAGIAQYAGCEVADARPAVIGSELYEAAVGRLQNGMRRGNPQWTA